MKKINLLIATLILASFAFVTSCTKDKTPPTINFKGGTGYTSSDVSVEAGTVLTFGITAESSSAKLENLKIIATNNNIPDTKKDTTFSSDTFNKDFSFPFNTIGDTRLTFTMTDKDGETAELSLIVTVTTAASTINSYTEVLLGSWGSPTGSSFASVDGTVYSLANAKTNCTKVDWMYYYGSAHQATLAAPDDALVATVFTNTTNGLQTWPTKNATRFTIISAGAVWDNVLTADDIAAIAGTPTSTDAGELQPSNIVAFKTAGNKLGLIKVSTITGTGATSTIKYDVKVQK
jgi:hypothetical protein